jgi:hypothetical protein
LPRTTQLRVMGSLRNSIGPEKIASIQDVRLGTWG